VAAFLQHRGYSAKIAVGTEGWQNVNAIAYALP
jgi:hypothetical protein